MPNSSKEGIFCFSTTHILKAWNELILILDLQVCFHSSRLLKSVMCIFCNLEDGNSLYRRNSNNFSEKLKYFFLKNSNKNMKIYKINN